MKKQFLGAALVLGALGFAGARPALAQVDALSVAVPFLFVIGHATLQPGTYRVIPDTGDPNLFFLTTKDGKSEAEVYTAWTDTPVTATSASLEFKVVDGKYYLTAIDLPGDTTREVALPEPAPIHHGS